MSNTLARPSISVEGLALYRVSLNFLSIFFVTLQLEGNSRFLESNPELADQTLLLFEIVDTETVRAHYNSLINVLIFSLVMGTIGFFTKFFIGLSTLLLFSLFSFVFTLGGWAHAGILIIFSFFFLLFSDCQARYSLDSCLRKFKIDKDKEFNWPIFMSQWAFVLLFFFAGINKLKYTGVDWIFSDNLRIYFAYAAIRIDSTTLQFLVSSPVLCQILAFGTLAFELSLPLAIFSKTARLILLPMTVIFFILVHHLLGEFFWATWPVMLCWLPWQGIHEFLQTHLSIAGARQNTRE